MELTPQMYWVVGLVVGAVLLVGFVISLFNKFLVKAAPGQALVKTGFGADAPRVYLSSAFVVPLFNRVDTIDLTVKTVRIVRRKYESLSCADGIRAEVEVDFYIKINSIGEDIGHVATTIGCGRASDTEILRELFEAKFADALKTAGAKLTFDQLYQNRRLFRDEILKALGQEGEGEVVLNGYKLDDVAIQFLEQLPLEQHNEDNVLDSRGRKEIAQRTSSEVEAANQRLRQKEVTIAEQNREARLRQLQIEQDIKEKEAAQKREIHEAEAREDAATQRTVAEQERMAEEARILRDKQVTVANELKQQEVMAAEIERQRAIELADEQKRQQVEQAQIARERAIKVAEQQKIQEVEIARIQREAAEAEALREKLKMLEETALQEAEKIRAEEKAQTVRALEIAQRQKSIEVIEAEKRAQVEKAMQQVEADVSAYEIRNLAQARLDAAALDSEAAEKQALAIEVVGRAEAERERLRLDAQNVIGERALLAQTLQQLIPLLPQLTAELMKPAEHIDSIKILNVTGMGGQGDGAPQPHPVASGVLGTILQTGMALPVLKELLGALQGRDGVTDVAHALRSLPGGPVLADALQQGRTATPIGDGAAPPVA